MRVRRCCEAASVTSGQTQDVRLAVVAEFFYAMLPDLSAVVPVVCVLQSPLCAAAVHLTGCILIPCSVAVVVLLCAFAFSSPRGCPPLVVILLFLSARVLSFNDIMQMK